MIKGGKMTALERTQLAREVALEIERENRRREALRAQVYWDVFHASNSKNDVLGYVIIMGIIGIFITVIAGVLAVLR